jgi:hypothetical protein
MAFFLAVLTWTYLFMQGNGPAEIEVQFLPRIDGAEFASATWSGPGGVELPEGGALKVRVLGPKADVRTLALRPKVFACSVRIEEKDLAGAQGTYARSLEREDFNLPAAFVVDPLPRLTLRFVRFEEREVELGVTPYSFEGTPRQGFEVESVTTVPRRVKVKAPADVRDLERVPIRRVPVSGRSESFSVPLWQLDPPPGLRIVALEPFAAEVKIALRPAVRQVKSELHVLARPEHLPRIQLETRQVVLELRGPEQVVEEAAARPGIFFPYVVVTEKDLESTGPKFIAELGCHILDPPFLGRLTVVVMADAQPAARQAKVLIRPR